MKLKSIGLFLTSAVLLTSQPSYSFDDSAADLLKREHFANLYNWRAATPLFQTAEPLFKKAGDRRNQMYAHLGTIRRDVSASIAERSQHLADLLVTDPLLTEHTDLRLFALTIKGDLDGEIDQSDARQDWTEVMSLAKELNNATWISSAVTQKRPMMVTPKPANRK